MALNQTADDHIDGLFSGFVRFADSSLKSCGCSSVVERHVANVNVVGSSPSTRFQFPVFQAGRPFEFKLLPSFDSGVGLWSFWWFDRGAGISESPER